MRRAAHSGVEVFERALRPVDVVHDDDGYALTSIPRTAVDLSARLALPEALAILDDAARRLVRAMLHNPRRGISPTPATPQQHASS